MLKSKSYIEQKIENLSAKIIMCVRTAIKNGKVIRLNSINNI